jgi:hypothetical protein
MNRVCHCKKRSDAAIAYVRATGENRLQLRPAVIAEPSPGSARDDKQRISNAEPRSAREWAKIG